MIQVAEHSIDKPEDGSTAGAATGLPGNAVNKSIQHLALKYCGESKSSFDELSKIIQVWCIYDHFTLSFMITLHYHLWSFNFIIYGRLCCMSVT